MHSTNLNIKARLVTIIWQQALKKASQIHDLHQPAEVDCVRLLEGTRHRAAVGADDQAVIKAKRLPNNHREVVPGVIADKPTNLHLNVGPYRSGRTSIKEVAIHPGRAHQTGVL